MWFLHVLSWIALAIQICVITLSIGTIIFEILELNKKRPVTRQNLFCVSAGLFYLAELVEEYTVLTAKVIKYLIIVVSVVHVCLLLFEDIPFTSIVAGLLGNGAYYLLLKDFPYFVLTSPGFIGSVLSVVVNHFLAFSYFTSVYHPFQEVLAYFTVCLWMVPFTFFVSLSANENVLPTMSERAPSQGDETDVVSSYFNKRGKKYGLLSFLKKAQEGMLPERVKKHF